MTSSEEMAQAVQVMSQCPLSCANTYKILFTTSRPSQLRREELEGSLKERIPDSFVFFSPERSQRSSSSSCVLSFASVSLSAVSCSASLARRLPAAKLARSLTDCQGNLPTKEFADGKRVSRTSYCTRVKFSNLDGVSYKRGSI